MFNADYWNNRVRRYGHTGHAEPFYYCFDQQARLFAIETAIKQSAISKNNAFDFGCGSGDFVELLSGQFSTVSGFDISKEVIELAKHRFNNSKVLLANNLNECIYGKTFDLILSVTVLQTLTHEQLEMTLALFNKILDPKGKLICMEFFATDEYNLEANENRITYNEWAKALQANNFNICTVTGFYNPILFPTKSWLLYKESFHTKFLKLLKHQKFAKKQLVKKANELIYKYKDVYPFQASSFKLYVIEKKRE